MSRAGIKIADAESTDPTMSSSENQDKGTKTKADNVRFTNRVENMLEFRMMITEESKYPAIRDTLHAKGKTRSGNQEHKKIFEDVISEEKRQKNLKPGK